MPPKMLALFKEYLNRKKEFPWLENPSNTAHDIRNHWTAVSTFKKCTSKDMYKA